MIHYLIRGPPASGKSIVLDQVGRVKPSMVSRRSQTIEC